MIILHLSPKASNDQPKHSTYRSSSGYTTAVGKYKKSGKKYFVKPKEDKIKESPLLNLKKPSPISPWIYVGLNNTSRHRETFVKNYVLNYLGVTIEDLSIKKGKGGISIKKKIFYYAMKTYCKLKLQYIADLTGTDHANVLHHIRDVEDKLDINDKKYVKVIEDLNKVLKND